MIRHLLSLSVGAALASLVFFLLVIPVVRKNWHAQGFDEGSIDARWAVSEKLHKEFPIEPAKCSDGRILFEIKTSTVYVFDCPDGKQIYVQR
jgi:hypothetical protein